MKKKVELYNLLAMVLAGTVYLIVYYFSKNAVWAGLIVTAVAMVVLLRVPALMVIKVLALVSLIMWMLSAMMGLVANRVSLTVALACVAAYTPALAAALAAAKEKEAKRWKIFCGWPVQCFANYGIFWAIRYFVH